MQAMPSKRALWRDELDGEPGPAGRDNIASVTLFVERLPHHPHHSAVGLCRPDFLQRTPTSVLTEQIQWARDHQPDNRQHRGKSPGKPAMNQMR